MDYVFTRKNFTNFDQKVGRGLRNVVLYHPKKKNMLHVHCKFLNIQKAKCNGCRGVVEAVVTFDGVGYT